MFLKTLILFSVINVIIGFEIKEYLNEDYETIYRRLKQRMRIIQDNCEEICQTNDQKESLHVFSLKPFDCHKLLTTPEMDEPSYFNRLRKKFPSF